MSEFNFFDIADVTTILISLCCCRCCCCCGGMTITDTNACCLGALYCFRVFIGLLVVSVEFSVENLIFKNETNQTIPAAYHDELISINIYLSYIFVITEIALITLCFIMFCCCTCTIAETRKGYWTMVTVLKVLMLLLDVTMFLFSLFLSLYAGDTLIDFSNSIASLKTVVSIIFLIQCGDIILDIIFTFRNVKRVIAVEIT